MLDHLGFLNQDNFQMYSRVVAKFCKSVNAAIILSDLVAKRKYHTNNNQLASHEKYGHGWFYYTIECCEERTCLTRKEQDSAFSILLKLDLIEICKFGLPQKRFFKIKDIKVLEIFGLSKIDSNLPEKDKLECPKRTNQSDQKGQIAHIYNDNKVRKHIYEDNVNEGTLSPYLHREKTMEISRKFKLTPEQSQSLDWLLHQNIDTTSETLAWWAREYSLKRLEQVFLESKKKKRDSIGAYMQKLLKSNAILETSNSEKNRSFAQDFKQANNWHSLEITQKYVKIYTPNGSTLDLYFEINPESFFEGILKMYECYEKGHG